MKQRQKTLLRRLSKLTVFSTLFLIFAGALVKSHEVGLSVPDWPTTYGEQMFSFPVSKMVGGIFYEHGHRLTATLVGFFMLIQAFWLGISDEQLWLKKLGYIALTAVILQGLLGGITVLLFLPPVVSILHGILAQTFFILTIIIAYALSKERTNRPEIEVFTKPIHKSALIMGGMVYIQLILGALMRHTASGLAIPDFPTMGGLWLPNFSDTMVYNINALLFDLDQDMVSKSQVIIHFSHRIGAVLVTAAILYFFYRFRSVNKNKGVQQALWLLTGIVLIQFTLGAITVLTVRAPYIASFHVVTGAALLGVCTLLIMRSAPKKLTDWNRATNS
tara:strand:+ start:1987 stop:2985 length:999 start_codon:yes stop_codon:yes gene_type:complete